MAKRDLKSFRKQPSNKKVYHIARGILFAECIILDNDIFNVLEEYTDDLRAIRVDASLDFGHIITEYEYKMNELRESLLESKPTAFQIGSINIAILNVYDVYKQFQKEYIEYDYIIEEAVYSDKFGY